MNHFLTEARIPYETAIKAGLRDNYAWHQKIWQAFPNKNLEAGEETPTRDFLTRIDDVNHCFRLLLLSATPPQRPSWCPEPVWRTKEVSENFLNHQNYQFSLLANPTIKKVVRDENGQRRKNGRRVAIHKNADLQNWLQQKASQHGFEVEPEKVRLIPQPKTYFIKKGQSGLHQGTDFRGFLKVTDPTLFQKAFTGGIGPAKAFGFGLLCLSPAS